MRGQRILLALTFLAGALLSGLLGLRSQVAGDQLKLLAIGWSLVERGIWLPYGNPTSAGGFSPGGMTGLFVGLPLMLWGDPRAATFLVFLTHVGAFILLDRLARETLSVRQRLLLGVFYWLNPWRVYFSGFLWNPNWLFLPGAIHLFTAYKQRERGSFGAGFLHAIAIAVGVQLHLSAVILAITTLLLVVRRRIRLHWWGAALGALTGSLTLIPWGIAVVRGGLTPPEGAGFIGRGLVYVYPLLRAVGYWLRYGSFLLAERATELDFTPAFGAEVDRWLAPTARWLIAGSGAVMIVAALLANLRLWRARTIESSAPVEWLSAYARLCFVGFMMAVALSPTTPMAWQGVSVFHAAVLALILAPTERIAPWFAGGSLVICLLVGFGAPQFRCGGRSDIRHTLTRIHPMLIDFGIQQRCAWPVAPDGGRPIEDTLIGR